MSVRFEMDHSPVSVFVNGARMGTLTRDLRLHLHPPYGCVFLSADDLLSILNKIRESRSAPEPRRHKLGSPEARRTQ